MPRRRWRAFYTVVGAVTAGVALINMLGPVQGALGGCSLRVSPVNVRVPGSASCMYALDLLAVGIPLLVGAIVLLGAWRYRHSGKISTALTALAIPIAIVVAAYPLYTVWWLVDYYRLPVGPMELLMFGVGLAILGFAVLAGWRTASYLVARGRG